MSAIGMRRAKAAHFQWVKIPLGYKLRPDAGCSQHAPDEHVLAPVLREGLQIMTGLFWDLAEGGVPRSGES